MRGIMNKGDVVRLKCGGPDMTVEYTAGESYEEERGEVIETLKVPEGRVRCAWFSRANLNNGLFSINSLVKIR